MTAEQIYRQLINLGRQRNRPGEEMITLYGLERVLNRLTLTRFADDFSLKGGVLLAAFSMRRPTRDIDMQALEFTLDATHMGEVIRAIARVQTDDGLTFALDEVRMEEIRDEEEYSGLRVHVPALLHIARVPIKLDVSTGDPIWPEPQTVTLPGLLGQNVHIKGSTLETVIAEKSVTIVQRGATSTRWRDYMDIRNIARKYPFNAGELRAAMEATAAFRGVQLEPIKGLLQGYDTVAAGKWAAWRHKNRLEDECLSTLEEQLADVSAFAGPILAGTVAESYRWDPTAFL